MKYKPYMGTSGLQGWKNHVGHTILMQIILGTSQTLSEDFLNQEKGSQELKPKQESIEVMILIILK